MYLVASAKESLDIDREIIEGKGIPSSLLMENAGLAVCEIILRSRPGRVAVVCGTGNNGADGFVVARKLASSAVAQVDVWIVSRSASSPKSEEGRTNRRLLDLYPNISVSDTVSVPNFTGYDLIVDAVLGTGSGGSPDPIFQKHFDAINESLRPVVAVDIPSGICPTTGVRLYDRPVHAATTVTFGVIKTGLLLYPARQYVGDLVLASICFPPFETQWGLNRIPSLPTRDPNGHKGTFGRALFIAGCGSYFGAPMLASLSFLKSGGGYASLATEERVAAVVASHAPEVVMQSSQCVSQQDVVVFGPGMGLGEDAMSKLDELVEQVSTETRLKTIVIDGDGITLLARKYEKGFLGTLALNVSVVLTPHAGEWARLFPECCASTHYDMVNATQNFLEVLSPNRPVVVVVKGSRTAIVSSSGGVRLNTTGNSGMATCGSGDVLSGVIACIVAQRKYDEVFEAVCDAVFIHGLAGDIAATEKGCEDGIIASDIMNHLPKAVGLVRNKDESLKKYFPKII